jgi:hypothetical protein
MQVGGTPGPVTDATPEPFPPHTQTQRIIERRRKHELRRADDWTPGPAPSLSRRAMVGICLITFASGILVATGIYRTRPSAAAAQPAPVEPIAPVLVPPVIAIQPLPKPAPEPEPAPLPAAAPVAAIAPPAHAVAGSTPAARARPAPTVRPKRPARAAAARVTAPRSTEPDLFAPPARPSKKWVDPFAE